MRPQRGCHPAVLTVSSLKDNFPNVFYLTDDPSLWYHLCPSPATTGDFSEHDDTLLMKRHRLEGDPHNPARCHRCVRFFYERALDSCAHEGWSYSRRDRRWNRGLNWTCQQLVPLHTSFFPPCNINRVSVRGFIMSDDSKAQSCSFDNNAKCIKERRIKFD